MRSPSQMTDTSSRDNSPRANSGRRSSKQVPFTGLETIASVSSTDECGDDSTIFTVGVDDDVPALCMDNIRSVYRTQTAGNKYHVRFHFKF